MILKHTSVLLWPLLLQTNLRKELHADWPPMVQSRPSCTVILAPEYPVSHKLDLEVRSVNCCMQVLIKLRIRDNFPLVSVFSCWRLSCRLRGIVTPYSQDFWASRLAISFGANSISLRFPKTCQASGCREVGHATVTTNGDP